MQTGDYFRYTRAQRSGIAMLFLLMCVVQLLYFLFSSTLFSEVESGNTDADWLAVQQTIDSLKLTAATEKRKIYPFNPNFISDYKGYVLGMTPGEIDRLHRFRRENKFVNSAEEFQKVTLVSDKLLAEISPSFKFPEWVTKKNRNKKAVFKQYVEKEKIVVADINAATQEQLMKVYGIGPALSERIISEREKLGAFVSMDQLKWVWGLSPEVVENLNKQFRILVKPVLAKVDINNASVKELSQRPFFRYALAKEIVGYRSMHGEIKSREDLMKIKNFPIDKVDIIALYLDF